MKINMRICQKCHRQYLENAFAECPYCTGQMNNDCEMSFVFDDEGRFTHTVDLSGGYTATDNGIGHTAPPEVYRDYGGGFGSTRPPEGYIDTVDNMKPTEPPRDGQRKEEEIGKTGPAFVVNGQTMPPPEPTPQPQPNPFITVPVGEVIEPVVGWLVAIDGKLKGKDFSIKGASATVGRDSSNKIQITGDDRVSRDVNCTIMYDYIDRVYNISPNLNITNRVRLNGHEFYAVKELRAFDQLKIGSTTFVFVPLCGQQFGWGEERR